MRTKNLFLTYIAACVLLISCDQDDENVLPPSGDYANGILISHEGSGTNSGSVSFVNSNLAMVENDIYNAVNAEELGVYQQSMGLYNDLAFVVVDNANTVAIVNRYTFEKIAVVTDKLATPRYIAFAGNKAYITNWGDTAIETDDFIAVMDLTDYTIEKTIPVSLGPEQIIAKGTTLYISHKGAFGSNNLVSVLDTNTDQVIEVEVGDNPDEMDFDTVGNLWVLCGGKTVFDSNWQVIDQTAGALIKINTDTNSVVTRIDFEGVDQPSLMDYENGNLFYALNGNLYQMGEEATSLPDSAMMSSDVLGGSLYGMEIEGDKLYVLDPKDFVSQGEFKVFDLDSKEELASLKVGIAPSKIYFN